MKPARRSPALAVSAVRGVVRAAVVLAAVAVVAPVVVAMAVAAVAVTDQVASIG